MRTPLSLRNARLLLVAAASGAFGVFAYIAVLARSFSVPLVVFPLAGLALVSAARSIGTDLRRGRLLAIAGGLALAATGVLAGFGAGNISLPMGALGILAAWAAVLHPPRRMALLAFGAYVAIGLLLTLPRGATLVAFPWLISSVVLWPWTSTLLLSAASFALPIYASIGLALALAVSALLPQRAPVGSPDPVTPRAWPGRRFVARTTALALLIGTVRQRPTSRRPSHGRRQAPGSSSTRCRSSSSSSVPPSLASVAHRSAHSQRWASGPLPSARRWPSSSFWGARPSSATGTVCRRPAGPGGCRRPVAARRADPP